MQKDNGPFLVVKKCCIKVKSIEKKSQLIFHKFDVRILDDKNRIQN